MIQRRALLTAFPFLFAAACARAQTNAAPSVAAAAPADMTGMPSDALTALTGGADKVVWLRMTGTVRLKAGNANPRPATLLRAIATSAQGGEARIFDVWQMDGSIPNAAPSTTQGPDTGATTFSPNDMGTDSIWLNRSFVHPALNQPIESSRIAATNARVIAIDATQIWVLEGALLQTSPALSGEAQAAFAAWRAGYTNRPMKSPH